MFSWLIFKELIFFSSSSSILCLPQCLRNFWECLPLRSKYENVSVTIIFPKAEWYCQTHPAKFLAARQLYILKVALCWVALEIDFLVLWQMTNLMCKFCIFAVFSVFWYMISKICQICFSHIIKLSSIFFFCVTKHVPL